MKTITYLLVSFFISFAEMTNAQLITTVCGTGDPGYTGGDGVAATLASIYHPWGVVTDAAGNLYIGDQGNNRIRKVSPSGIITTIAGNGYPGYSGDGGPATAAEINAPQGVVLDLAGNVYFADGYNNCVRKVDMSGVISTFAGTGALGYGGDGGPATASLINNPHGIAIDNGGNIYIADYGNTRVRKVTTDGIIHTIAGNGYVGYSGDGGPATAAEMDLVNDVAVDNHGNLFIADYNNNVIRRVDTSYTITTFAGTGAYGYSGDGGPATAAEMVGPGGICFDNYGSVYFGDVNNNVIRKINPDGVISTFAGTGTAGYSGDGGEATAATFYRPGVVTFDGGGNFYVADIANNRIRKIALPSTSVSVTHRNVAEIIIFPNPASSIINIKGAFDFSAQIIGEDGKIYKCIRNESPVDISELPVGDYILSIYGSSGETLNYSMFSKI